MSILFDEDSSHQIIYMLSHYISNLSHIAFLHRSSKFNTILPWTLVNATSYWDTNLHYFKQQLLVRKRVTFLKIIVNIYCHKSQPIIFSCFIHNCHYYLMNDKSSYMCDPAVLVKFHLKESISTQKCESNSLDLKF